MELGMGFETLGAAGAGGGGAATGAGGALDSDMTRGFEWYRSQRWNTSDLDLPQVFLHSLNKIG